MIPTPDDRYLVTIDSHTIVDQPLHNLEERLALLDKNAMTHHFPI
jgi:hypothetical protein